MKTFEEPLATLAHMVSDPNIFEFGHIALAYRIRKF